MTTRRQFLQGTAAGAAALAAGGAAAAPLAVPARATLTPDEALQRLIDGNRQFLRSGTGSTLTGAQRRLDLAQAQAPIAAYVSCSDSRVPPEVLFGRGLGELFIIRNAGNTIDTVALGSIEYAVGPLLVPLVVVMGHERCGAVAAAVAVVETNATFPGSSIGAMVEPIIPAVLSVRGKKGDLLDNSVRANVSRQVGKLRTATDPLMLDPQRAGTLKVVGAYYDLDTGEVDFFDRP